MISQCIFDRFFMRSLSVSFLLILYSFESILHVVGAVCCLHAGNVSRLYKCVCVQSGTIHNFRYEIAMVVMYNEMIMMTMMLLRCSIVVTNNNCFRIIFIISQLCSKMMGESKKKTHFFRLDERKSYTPIVKK